MIDELATLHKNNTWDLIPRPSNSNSVGSKWTFFTKYKENGSIDHFKSRLVAQEFSQIPGFDFSHTFNQVIKFTTV